MKAFNWIILLLLYASALQSQTLPEIKQEAKNLLEKEQLEVFVVYLDQFLNDNQILTGFEKSELANMKASKLLSKRDSDRALIAYEQAHLLAKLSGNADAENESVLALIQLYIMKSQPHKAKKIARAQLQNSKLALIDHSSFNSFLGNTFFNEGELDSAEVYLKKALNFCVLSKDTLGLAQCYRSYSKILAEHNELDSALVYAIKGLSFVNPNSERDQLKVYSLLLNVSQIFKKQGNYYKAKEYGQFCLDTCKRYALSSSKAYSYYNLGAIDLVQGNLERALLYSDSALESISENQFNGRSVLSFQLLKLQAQLLQEEGLDEKLYQEVLSKKDEFSQTEVLDVINVIEFSFDSRLMNVIDFEAKFNELWFENEGAYNHVQLKRLLYIKLNFQKKNNDIEALSTMQEIDSLDALVFKKNQEFLVHDLEARYRKAEQEKEIKSQSQEIVSKNKFLIAIITGLVLAVLLLGVSLLLYSKLKKRKKDLEVLLNANDVLLQEKNTLLREIHHRVKNNLQVVSSLLNWQSRETKDEIAKQALGECSNRVQSMLLIHQHLYSKENLTGVKIRLYFENLIQNLVSTYQIGEDITFSTDIEDLNLDIDTVVPLGLSLNELITNSVKHAFAEGTTGNIKIHLKEHDNKLFFKVEDNGVGIKDVSLAESSDSFGFEIIKAFSNKLNAELIVSGENGTSVEMIIKSYQVNQITTA